MKTKKINLYNASIYTILMIASLLSVVPLIFIAIVSISNDALLIEYGFSVSPRKIDFSAWSLLFQDIKTIGWYGVWTLIISIIRPALVIAIATPFAYVLTKKNFVLQKFYTAMLLGTMFISGGLIPTYVIYSKAYGLVNNPIIYFLTAMVTAWGVIIFRTFFKQLPSALIEAAEIDGATEAQVFLKIILPMSKSVIGIQFFQSAIHTWNDYQTSLIYMNGNKIFWSIQYYMQKILQDAKMIKSSLQAAGLSTTDIPETTLKYAMCLFSLLPIFIIFPYVQKFFSKGIAVGSVKG